MLKALDRHIVRKVGSAQALKGRDQASVRLVSLAEAPKAVLGRLVLCVRVVAVRRSQGSRCKEILVDAGRPEEPRRLPGAGK